MSSKRKTSIVNALKMKGFSKRAAINIAKSTLRKSKSKPVKDKQSESQVCSWKQSVPAYLGITRNATKTAAKLHKQAAINKSTMAGKVVVVKPSAGTV